MKEVEKLTTKNAIGVADQVEISFAATRKDLRGVFAKINKRWSTSTKGGGQSQLRVCRGGEEEGEGERVTSFHQ